MANGSDPIPLHDLTDRDLLVLAVQGVNELKAQVPILHRRVSKLELWRFYVVGVSTGITALFGFLIEYFFHRK